MTNRVTVKVQRVAGVTPTPLAEGEIGVNLGDTPPSLWIGNTTGTPVRVGNCIVSANAPIGPTNGDFWFNTGDQTLNIYNGGVWVVAGGGMPDIASGAEVVAGLNNAKVITPKALADGRITTPDTDPKTDANKLIAVGSTGGIDLRFLQIPGLFKYRGAFDVTASTLPTAPAPAQGDFVINSAAAAGNADAAWTGVAGTSINPNQYLWFDGTNWKAAGTTLEQVWANANLYDFLTEPSITPTNDAGKGILLGTDGKINVGFLDIPGGMNYRGGFDVTAATLPTNLQAGDYVMNTATAAATPNAAWVGLDPAVNIAPNSMLVWDGTAWRDAGSTLDMDSFLPLLGGTMDDGAGITFDTTAAAAAGDAEDQIIIDGDGGSIDNVVLAGGVIAAPTAADVTVTPGAIAADEVTITFAAGPIGAAGKKTLTMNFTATPAVATITVTCETNDTSDMVANRAAAAIAATALNCVKIGPSQIHVAKGTATTLTAVTASMA